jgi:hypothetical protein
VDGPELIHCEESEFNVPHVDLVSKSHRGNEIALNLIIREAKPPKRVSNSIAGPTVAT